MYCGKNLKEQNIQSKIRLAVSKLRFTIFRQNTGFGWVGNARKVGRSTVIIDNARPFTAGLCVGSSDLIGFKAVTITPEMVGRKIAVFTAIEVKSKTGRLTEEQKTFLAAVNNAGGIGIVARSDESAIKGILQWITRMQS